MFNRQENLKQYVRNYPVISILIGINLIVYILGLVSPGIEARIFYYGIASNLMIDRGEYWRLITAIFIHSGFMHLLFNMFALYVFGPELEKIAGKMRFFTIFIVSGIMGNVITYAAQPLTYNSVGASGAIFGIFGAYIALVYYTRKILPQLRQYILPIVVISVVMTFLQSNVNVTAHIAGLIVGMILGFLNFHPKTIARWQKKQQDLKK